MPWLIMVAWFGTNRIVVPIHRAGMKTSGLGPLLSNNVGEWCCESCIPLYTLVILGHRIFPRSQVPKWNPGSPVRHKALPKKSTLCQVSPRNTVAARAVNTGLV